MKSRITLSLLCVSSLVVTALNGPAAGIPITVRDGLNGADVPDARLVSGIYSGLNFGDSSETLLGVGAESATIVDRGILRFDLSPYAGQPVLSNGTLTLTVSINQSYDGVPIHLYQINSANAGWSETTATWDNYNQLAPTAWTGGPGLGSPGAGYGATPIASTTLPSYPVGSSVSFTIPQAVLQDWIDNPANNAGLLLRANDESAILQRLFLDSASVATAANRPTLTFTIPEPSAGALLGLIGLLALCRRRA